MEFNVVKPALSGLLPSRPPSFLTSGALGSALVCFDAIVFSIAAGLPASRVLRTHLTSCWRSCQHYRLRRFLTVPPGDVTPPFGNQQDLPVLALGMSAHPQVLRLRRVRRDLAISRPGRYCLLPVPAGSPRGSSDVGARWLARVSSRRCHTRDVTVASAGVEARATG